MNNYKTLVVFNDNSKKLLEFSKDEILAHKNINFLIFSKFNNVKRILVFLLNNNTGKHYSNLTYDSKFEIWKNNRTRIERTNKEGYEDLTGYGSRTNGLKNRFYIGKSTGFIPIYLEILKNNSSGGTSLFWKHGTFKTV